MGGWKESIRPARAAVEEWEVEVLETGNSLPILLTLMRDGAGEDFRCTFLLELAKLRSLSVN